ncbi:hypothetical protein GGF46_001875 [Coemansia sp. RSA 552]|nr:hypothetical protein GGF46_001875 [Coemansia sp. RSA 552]
MLTPVDPLFIYLWLLTKATQSGKSGDEWRFFDVDNIALESELDAESTAAFLAMKDLKERALKTLCEVRCVSDDVKVARIDPEAVQRWLKRKCGPERLPAALEASITGSDELKEQGKTREMMLLVSEYLSPSWTERLSASFDGFAKVVESERLVAKHAMAVVFDAPESYTQGIADPHSKPAKQPEARPKTAKEKQLEKAARKSKPITSFFQKK